MTTGIPSSAVFLSLYLSCVRIGKMSIINVSTARYSMPLAFWVSYLQFNNVPRVPLRLVHRWTLTLFLSINSLWLSVDDMKYFLIWQGQGRHCKVVFISINLQTLIYQNTIFREVSLLHLTPQLQN